MPTVASSDQTPIHYRVIGNGPRNVLLVHGWMMSGAVFDEFVDKLDTTGLRLVIPDLRGSGESGAPAGGYTLEQLVRDVLAVADHAGLKRFTVVGHSMGGQIAQWVAAQEGERVEGLVVLNTVPASGLPLPPDAAGLFRTSAGDRQKQKTILGLACLQLPEASLERLLKVGGAVAEASIKGCFDAWTGGGFEAKLASITAPTLVVATDDPFLPPAFLRERVVNLIKGARLAYLPGPGHYPQVERPAETAALLTSFLAGLGR
ncbi:alpha/beta fold hydrolase [Vitiosangium sp. GDMCC 1.1324]|uniref:alpha/beta fold hydrolase n=1 Tax=Vitiosangium sp. (strain GDMCC 1.1324) TaxID=2138576 RepID=UPI000D3D8B55|nr:alpha/beta hydrolase [Vitiosangium sp. GDMCC 1.1324]PTL84959.1 alpha/beta hydrolase [Vitiosangium sp. GDMCC 1.1324]